MTNHARRRRVESLPPAASAFLADALAALRQSARGDVYGHARRLDRIAVTCRPCIRGTDRVPVGALEFDAYRLFSLGCRICAGPDAALVQRMPLAIYKPVIDLPGTGRVSFRVETVFDVAAPYPQQVDGQAVQALSTARHAKAAATAVVMAHALADADPRALEPLALPPLYWAFPKDRPPVFEPQHAPLEYAESEVKIGRLSAWPAELFARRPGEQFAVHPVDGTPRPEGDPAEGARQGDWFVRDGVWTPRAQTPGDVYTYLRPLRGRTVRNPAYAVLCDASVLPGDLRFRAWLDQMLVNTDDGRKPRDHGDPSTTTYAVYQAVKARFNASAADYDALMTAMTVACQVIGVSVSDPEYLEELLLEPWREAFIEDSARISVVKLAGAPDPATLRFVGAATELDLYDVGAPFEQVDPERIAEARQQLRADRRRPSWAQAL